MGKRSRSDKTPRHGRFGVVRSVKSFLMAKKRDMQSFEDYNNKQAEDLWIETIEFVKNHTNDPLLPALMAKGSASYKQNESNFIVTMPAQYAGMASILKESIGLWGIYLQRCDGIEKVSVMFT